MTINFIPNDPLAGASMPTRRSAPRPNRPSNRAGFKFFDSVPEGLFDQGTPEFLFWQCREAALLSVEVWETLNGSLTKWARNRKRLDLQQDAGDDLNAFYDTHSLSFFHHSTGTRRLSQAKVRMWWRTKPGTLSWTVSARISGGAHSRRLAHS